MLSRSLSFSRTHVEYLKKDISIATIKPNGRGEATLDLEKLTNVANQIIANKSLINEHFKVLGSEVTLFLYDLDTYKEDIENRASGSCSFGARSLHVRANGDVLGCTACEGIILGNIFANDDVNYLKNIWTSNRILERIRSKNHLTGICSNCKFLDFCGGYRCRAYGVHGDLFAEDPYCPIVISQRASIL